MAYMQRKQVSQYVLGWTRHLPPTPPTALTAAQQAVPATVATYDAETATFMTGYDEWRLKDSIAMGIIKGTLRGQYLTYVVHCTTSK